MRTISRITGTFIFVDLLHHRRPRVGFVQHVDQLRHEIVALQLRQRLAGAFGDGGPGVAHAFEQHIGVIALAADLERIDSRLTNFILGREDRQPGKGAGRLGVLRSWPDT